MAEESHPPTPFSSRSGATNTTNFTRPTGSTIAPPTQGSTSPLDGTYISFVPFLNNAVVARTRASSSTSMVSNRAPPASGRGLPALVAGLDLNAVNVGLIGSPTIAPENTPANMTPDEQLHAGPNLPTIDEALERLPNMVDGASSTESTCANARNPEEDGGVPLVSSSSTMISMASSPPPHEGVREHTDWQEDIEGDLDRALARLANLAQDDHEQNSSLTAQQHYTRRLDAAIERQRMRYTYLQDAKSTMTTLLLQRAKLRTILEYISTHALEKGHEAQARVQKLLEEIDADEEENKQRQETEENEQ